MGMVTVLQSDIDDAMDDCGIDTVIIDPAKLSCENTGMVNIVTLTVIDVFGASASCEAEVTVFDTIAPVCSTMDITVELDENGMASTYYVHAVSAYAELFRDDLANYYATHQWEIHYSAAIGDLWLPVGYFRTESMPAADHLAEAPWSAPPPPA